MNCQQCDNRKNLWICVICGFTGCGRYFSRHAVAHYEATRHPYSIEVASQRIWNYNGDSYAHSIIRKALMIENENSIVTKSMLMNKYVSEDVQSAHALTPLVETVNTMAWGRPSSNQKGDTSHASQQASTNQLQQELTHVERNVSIIESSSLTSHPSQQQQQPSQPMGSSSLDDKFVLEKIQSLIREYNHLLTSQLEE